MDHSGDPAHAGDDAAIQHRLHSHRVQHIRAQFADDVPHGPEQLHLTHRAPGPPTQRYMVMGDPCVFDDFHSTRIKGHRHMDIPAGVHRGLCQHQPVADKKRRVV